MKKDAKKTEEQIRLEEDNERRQYWKKWGPYLSSRQWGTVREDYSPDGKPWEYFPHDHARSRAYRWGEDGIAGICDNHQILCFAPAFWNGQDSILKERLFGLNNTEGNHGEDIKEYLFYLDNTPTHSYMKCLYKYPQNAYPYEELMRVNKSRTTLDPEYELLDTKIFEGNRYFDIFVEYAKNSPTDILVKITAINRGPEAKELHVLPTLWFRNTWSWDNHQPKPSINLAQAGGRASFLEANHSTFLKYLLFFEEGPNALFTDNETNYKRLFGFEGSNPYVKDGIHRYVVNGEKEAVSSKQVGTKASVHYRLMLQSGETKVIRLRLTDKNLAGSAFQDFESSFELRRKEADDFYNAFIPKSLTPDMRNVQRQAFAGMLWNKQFYHYVVEEWLKGDTKEPAPSPERKHGRNADWTHLYTDDILSMPDTWEYPWFAAWDLAFHCIPLCMIDPEFAKKQLMLLTREWYMHPNGEIPAYEWNFSDVNPPVHAWAAWRVYKIEKKMFGRADRLFLERVFQKLLLNFTWWVNRKDAAGNNIFQGGFLGLDNISIFNRSMQLPAGGRIDQSDGTSWMGMYCLNMLTIALELALDDRAYEDIASKFFEHFLYIAQAMNRIGEESMPLWNDEDGFYYDRLHLPDGQRLPLKVRSMVGLIPLCGIAILEPEVVEKLHGFKKRLEWFIENRPDLSLNVACMRTQGVGARRILSIVKPIRLAKILEKMLDQDEFLAPGGIRSISKYHQDHPYILRLNGNDYRVDYEPAESRTRLFGGNSNWRGPVWFPTNFLILEALQKFHYYLGDDFKVECPRGSGKLMNLWEVASEIAHRLLSIFEKDEKGRRPVYGGTEIFQSDPLWKDYILFYEYFNGDNSAGIGASHQTGWTGLAAKLVQQCGEYCLSHKHPNILKQFTT